MTTYLTIMVTVLAVCETVRIIQNHINLRRQRIVFERECGHLSDFTDDDLKTQREAYRLIVENLTPLKYDFRDMEIGGGDNG